MAIDREAPRAVRSQLEEGLRTAIRSGRLEPGEKLPSSRELARAMEVSRGLVIECYQQLQSEGYLHSEVGSATRVAATAAALPPMHTPPAAKPLPMAVDFIAGVLTWPASPARTGCGPNERRSDRHPPTPWATETQLERRSCAPSWPPMSAESVQPPWTRARCWCAADSPRASA